MKKSYREHDYNNIRFKCGLFKMFHQKLNMLYILFIGLLCTILFFIGKHYILKANLYGFNNIVIIFSIVFTISMFLFLSFIAIILIATPIESFFVEEKLERMGLKDTLGQTPLLIDKQKINKRLYYYHFYSDIFTISDFNKYKESFPVFLKGYIKSIENLYAKNKNIISIKVYQCSGELPKKLTWYECEFDDILNKDFVIRLGKTEYDDLTIDLNETYHACICSSSGGGKSVLMCMIAYQCLRKGAEVYLADFKKADFRLFKNKCNVISEINEFDELLIKIRQEIDRRNDVFASYDNNIINITEYNKVSPDKMPRLVLMIDEIAVVTGKKGETKEEKALYNRISENLNDIMALGRSVGISVFVAGQRIDSTNFDGTAKNNFSLCICGRANEVSSRMLIGSDLASTIDSDDKGVFYTDKGIKFKGYMFDKNDLEKIPDYVGSVENGQDSDNGQGMSDN